MNNTQNELGFYRIYDIVGDRKRGIPALIPMCRSKWYQGIRAGIYPQPIQLGERAVAWRKSDIHALIASLENGGAK